MIVSTSISMCCINLIDVIENVLVLRKSERKNNTTTIELNDSDIKKEEEPPRL